MCPETKSRIIRPAIYAVVGFAAAFLYLKKD